LGLFLPPLVLGYALLTKKKKLAIVAFVIWLIGIYAEISYLNSGTGGIPFEDYYITIDLTTPEEGTFYMYDNGLVRDINRLDVYSGTAEDLLGAQYRGEFMYVDSHDCGEHQIGVPEQIVKCKTEWDFDCGDTPASAKCREIWKDAMIDGKNAKKTSFYAIEPEKFRFRTATFAFEGGELYENWHTKFILPRGYHIISCEGYVCDTFQTSEENGREVAEFLVDGLLDTCKITYYYEGE
jgi:ribosomal protein S27E